MQLFVSHGAALTPHAPKLARALIAVLRVEMSIPVQRGLSSALGTACRHCCADGQLATDAGAKGACVPCVSWRRRRCWLGGRLRCPRTHLSVRVWSRRRRCGGSAEGGG